MDVHVDNLAEFLFVKNVHNLCVDMSFEGEEMKTSKDLFYFFLDLFCKGLVLTFGDGTNTVDVPSLTEEQFAIINKKMQNAGIEVKLVVHQTSNDEAQEPDDITSSQHTSSPASVNFPEIMNMPDNLPLNEYSFRIILPTVGVMYVITFDLIHNVARHHCNNKHTFNK